MTSSRSVQAPWVCSTRACPAMPRRTTNPPTRPVRCCVAPTRKMMRHKITIRTFACATLMALHAPWFVSAPVSQPAPVISKAQKIDPQKQVAVIDSVVAVVNDDVITRQELNERLRVVIGQLQKQGTPLPAPDVLEREMRARTISDMRRGE